MATGKADYDDALVDMLADGNRTYGQIAEALGLSEAYVGKVARGERRPQLQARLRLSQQARMNEAKRLGARWAGALLRRHIKLGLDGDGEMARKCREFALDRCCFRHGEAWADQDPSVSAVLARLPSTPAGWREDEEDEDWAGEGAEDFSPHESGPIRLPQGEEAAAPPGAQVRPGEVVAEHAGPDDGRGNDASNE